MSTCCFLHRDAYFTFSTLLERCSVIIFLHSTLYYTVRSTIIGSLYLFYCKSLKLLHKKDRNLLTEFIYCCKSLKLLHERARNKVLLIYLFYFKQPYAMSVSSCITTCQSTNTLLAKEPCSLSCPFLIPQ